MRVAVYGGSFNPPHVAHAMVASWVLWTGAADEVWLVPVYRHAFEGRHGKTLAPFDRRVQWCDAMCADLGPRVRVSRIERELPVPSYTVDTLGVLAERNPDRRFRLVVGSDVLPQTGQWKAWDQIVSEFAPITAGRPGFPAPGIETIEFPDVSSTDIRDRLGRGQSVDHLVSKSVASLLRDAPVPNWRS